MDKLFLQIINMSITSSYVILFVLIIRLFLKRTPKIFSYGLWSIVFLRLVFPFSFESIFSLISINTKTIPQEIIYAQSPQINSGIVAVDRVVNNYLPAPTVVGASVNPMQIWIFLGQTIWLIGIGVLIIYTIFTTIGLSRRLKSAKLLHDNIYETNNIKTPFIFGVINPKIYLPKDLSETEIPYIIKHEQTHIKRFDHIVKFVAFLVLSVHWFNPLVWLSFFLMSKDMELSCDEKVIKEMGPKIKKDYSNSLLTLSTGRRIIGGSPLAFSENNTKGRIKNILNYRKPGFWVTVVAIIVIIVASVGLLSNPKEKEVNGRLPKDPWLGMVMVDGSLYKYTEKKLPSKIDKVEIIGKIKSTVEHHERPTKDSQANFEIEGSKYGKYKGNLLVLIDKKWVIFINEEHWNKGVSIKYDGALIKNIFGDLSDKERYDLLSWISLEVQTDNNYQINLDKIIEESFKYFGIKNSYNLDYAKSSLEITVSDRDPSIEDYAKEFINQQIAMFKGLDSAWQGFKIIDSKITKLEKLETFHNILSSPIEIWSLEYRLKPDDITKVAMAGGMQEEDGWITEDSSMGKPYLAFTNEENNMKYLGSFYPQEFGFDTLAKQEISLRIMLENNGLIPNEIYKGNHVVIKFPLSTGEISKLLLSQPVIQGNNGIWVAERWMDGNGNMYHVTPRLEKDIDMRIDDYYRKLQNSVSKDKILLDPIEVGYDYIINKIGQKSVKKEDLVIIDPATIEDFIDPLEKTAKEIEEKINKLEKQFGRQGLLVGYIVFDGNKLYLDEVEVIKIEDKNRIEELELKYSDMPNGYHIHNPSNEKTSFELTNETSYTFTDYHLLFVENPNSDRLYTTTNKEEFIQHLTTSYSDNPPAQKVPFFIEVKDGKVINIIEEFIFTQ